MKEKQDEDTRIYVLRIKVIRK